MSGAVVGATFSAVQLVYAAYRDVRSNKERCTTLVKRAEFVVDQLQSLINSQGEESVVEQLGVLQSAFEETARVIQNVGHQNWFMALLYSDRDTVQIEHCHRCLTDLMALCNIEQTIDQRALQSANERARRHDHKELIYVAQGVQSELIAQGEMIGEVLQMVRSLSSQSFEDHTPATSQPSLARQRATSPVGCMIASGSTVPAGAHAVTSGQAGSTRPTYESSNPRRPHRQSWRKKWRLQLFPTVLRRPLPAAKTIPINKVVKPTALPICNPVRLRTSVQPAPLPRVPECFRAEDCVRTSELPSVTQSPPCAHGTPEGDSVSDTSASWLESTTASTHSINPGLGPAGRAGPSWDTACSGVCNEREQDVIPHILTVTHYPTTSSRQSTSPLQRSTDTGISPPRLEVRSRPVCSSRYVEIRYYSGDVSSGVLLSESFETLGQTSLSELKLACSCASDPALLARLDEGSFLMYMPGNLQPTSMLNITPLVTHKYSVPIVWVVKSRAHDLHLEPIKVLSIERNLHPEWVLVACDKSTQVGGMMKIVGGLLHVEVHRLFCRGAAGRFQIAKTQLLRDCGVGRGMYLEVEID